MTTGFWTEITDIIRAELSLLLYSRLFGFSVA